MTGVLALSGAVLTFIVSNAITILLIGGVALVFQVRHRRKRRSNPDYLTYKATVALDAPLAEVVQLARSALRATGGSIVSVNVGEGIVLAKFGTTMRSWGQYLQFDIWPQDDGTCKCACRSWPSWDSQVVDWGAGRRTVERFVQELKNVATGKASVESIPTPQP